eukprot:TRINITY_DN22461_c0_g1_i1.p1 TRINITY_DN22461_c0_g1~~TRINITY_DN22461_c0_g1_i1.p1  ORF type:complete len:301 (+),score=87.20 TRINITY_DN22461_c0_g1_i1:34-903(+)
MELSLESISSNLSSQLDELEILQAMFPDPKEIEVDFCNVVDVRDWLENTSGDKANNLPSLIDFSLHLTFDGKSVETVITLPTEYPSLSLPEVYTRANHLSRLQQASLNSHLQQYLDQETILEEPCLTGVISWLQENCETYFEQNDLEPEKQVDKSLKNTKFSRLWIYSHHLYSKIKRKDILDLAPEFCLTGFSMPGKPGVICVEGVAQNCADWWSLVRHWNWKKINVKIQEDKDTEDVDGERLFDKFEEIGTVKNTGRDYHMDMGEFYRYLESHNCTWMFKELFGIDKS